MEINITSLLETDMFEFSHSRAEGGENAGQNTWNAALKGPRLLLQTPEEFEAFRDYVKGFGAWDEEEIAAWDENECQALFLQMIAGDVRQCPGTLEDVEITMQAVTGNVPECGWYYTLPESPDMETGPYESRSEAYQAASEATTGRAGILRAESLDEIDWPEYEIQANKGRISGNLYRSDNGEVFYSLSN